MRAIEAGLRFLVSQGVKYIFGVPAGSINALYDCLHELPELTSIVAKHESSSGYMAAAYTRITGIPSVCVGSSGPGATNLVTPAANAWREKLPVIFLTGAIPTTKFGRGGGQELNADPIFASITKLSITVTDPMELPRVLAEAYNTAISGTPGPVHITIPINIQMTEIGEPEELKAVAAMPVTPDEAEIEAAAAAVVSAGRRGALLLGHGSKAFKETMLHFAELTGWPVATTPRGKGAFPENHPLALGVYGLASNDSAVEYLRGDNHDLLMIVGSALGESATSSWDERLVDGKQIIHIDHDKRELGKCFDTAYPVHGDIELAMWTIIDRLTQGIQEEQLQEISKGYLEAATTAESAGPETEDWNTKAAIRQLNLIAPDNARYYVDIGEFMTYSIQNIKVRENQAFDININFGGMGSGISGALGAQLAEPDRPVISITGDGCFFMHGMEVLTAKEYNLPIVFVVINNARLGMVYHGHLLQYKRCLEDFSQERTQIADVAKALGIRYAQANSLDELRPELAKEWFDQSRGPIVIEINVEGNEVPPMGERVKFLQGATY
ncbi:thiamine pyrophosphate-binding protein [Paenibacillus glycanilyticus]|uniref:Acetolactate synthase, large subunit, biosynthetic type n=1 Tax=Paenibacillus glycanilyticus TaxID=126569 RepID=A0ABQ6GCK1_9BACL|nr:thiamine pyrophosphate-binding protein [Paenibacillus glycanilyticus]GLX67973.1 acetolactate synthase, large subunit, biosynthetic type [Paenibacillus glycanilyticus]